METQRQKRIANLLQEETAQILQRMFRDIAKGLIITVTKAKVTSDLTESRLYISIFPPSERERIFQYILNRQKTIRYELGQRIRHQLRRIPELHFHIDDSLDYIDEIDKALRNENENPIENPELLPKRKKL